MIPTELEEQFALPMAIGDTERILHQECSVGKTAAMAVRRTAQGWLWNCFRCGFHGFKSSSSQSPEEVLATLEKLQNTKPVQVTEYATLPLDYIKLSKVDSAKLPREAFTWLWKYHITNDLIQKYEIGWSEYYKRIIFPVYDTHLLHNRDIASQLIGWFGRDPFYKKEVERVDNVYPKWLISKAKGLPYFYYHITSPSFRIVLTEDVLSAIRVHHASGCQTLALGTTFIPKTLVMKMKTLKIVIWLDGDMYAKSLNYLSNFKSLGIDVTYRHTPWDPKEYGVSKIKEILGEE